MNFTRTSGFSALALFLLGTATGAIGCASGLEPTPGEVVTGEVLGESTAELKRASCGGRAGDSCGIREFCSFPLDAVCGRADAQGTCARRPSSCGFSRTPVCGCDGVTYRNACAANRSGVSVFSKGACAPVPVACGSDSECASADIGPNATLCAQDTLPAKTCDLQTSACAWSCKAPEPVTTCPLGQKKCPTCGAPPPDGICRSFTCVSSGASCPLVP
jgi:Kazal-type serine protease inhibitor domain